MHKITSLRILVHIICVMLLISNMLSPNIAVANVMTAYTIIPTTKWVSPPIELFPNTTEVIVYENNTAANITINTTTISLDPTLTAKTLSDEYMIGLKLVQLNIIEGNISWLNISIYNDAYKSSNITIVNNTAKINSTTYIYTNNTTLSNNIIKICGEVKANSTAIVELRLVYYKPVDVNEDNAVIIVQYPIMIEIDT